MRIFARVGSLEPGTGRRSRMPRPLSSVLLALSMIVGTFGFLATPASTLAWDANGFSSSAEAQLLALTNQARAAAGLSAVRIDSYLSSLARWRAQDMIQNNYFSHTIPSTGGKVWDVLIQKGYCFNLAAENIAWNTYPDDVATTQVQSQFMNSAAHRKNIVNARYDVVGIGAYKGADGKKMWAVVFVDKCGTTAPAATPKPAAPKPAAPKPATPKPVTTTPVATPVPTPVATPAPTPTPTAEPEATPARTKTLAGAPIPTPEPADVPAAPAHEKNFFEMIGDAISAVVSSISGMIHGLIGG